MNAIPSAAPVPALPPAPDLFDVNSLAHDENVTA